MTWLEIVLTCYSGMLTSFVVFRGTARRRAGHQLSEIEKKALAHVVTSGSTNVLQTSRSLVSVPWNKVEEALASLYAEGLVRWSLSEDGRTRLIHPEENAELFLSKK